MRSTRPLANTTYSVSVRSGKLRLAPVAEVGVQEPRREGRRKPKETFYVTQSEDLEIQSANGYCIIRIAVGARG